MEATIDISNVYQGQDFFIRALVKHDVAGAEVPVEQADVEEITYKVFDAEGTQTGSGTCEVATTIFDELQTWENKEYNAKYPISGEGIPDAATYRVQVWHDGDLVVARDVRALVVYPQGT